MNIYRSAAGADEIRRRYLELLDAWPVPAKRLRVPTGQGETFVMASGPPDAPPVLALHGSGANSAIWLPQIAELAKHLRVYAVDMIGEPGLSAPARPPLGSEAYALWLDDVLRGLGPDRVSVIGESLGGWLALDYAIRRPDRVTRLALLTPSGVGRRKVGILLRFALLSPFGDRGRRVMLGTVAGPAANTPVGEYIFLVVKHFRPRLRIPVFGDDALRTVRMPVLVIAGERDVMLDHHDTGRRLHSTVPHAEVRLLPEAGHLLPDQTPAILEFLTSDSEHHV